MNEVYNLNEGISESFVFEVNGHRYNFRYPTTEEAEKLAVVRSSDRINELSSKKDKTTDEQAELDSLRENESKAVKDFLSDLFRFITKEKDDSPDFSEVFPKLTVPQQRAFRKMLEAELGQNA